MLYPSRSASILRPIDCHWQLNIPFFWLGVFKIHHSEQADENPF